MKRMGVLWVFVLCVVGCAKPVQRGKAGEAAMSAGIMDGGIQFQWVSGTQGELMVPVLEPDSQSSKAFSHVVQDGQTLILKHALQLSEKPMFLVWNEKAWGSVIQDASYALYSQDFKSRSKGQLNRQIAGFDRESRRWFLSLTNLLEGNFNADPTRLMNLSLDFLLADHRKVELTIQFRALGTPPQIQVEYTGRNQLGVGAPADLHHYSHWLQTSDVVVRSERITHPAQRTISIQVRMNSSNVSLLSDLVIPRGPVQFNAYIDTPMHMKELRVQRSSQSLIESYVLSNGGWIDISLQPHESVILSWVASVVPGTPQCPDSGRLPVPQSWYDEVRFLASWNREIRVEGVATSYIEPNLSISDILSTARPHLFSFPTCRGLFL